MLKATLLCTAVCGAFLLGDSAARAPQDPARRLPNTLERTLKLYAGQPCTLGTSDQRWSLEFRGAAVKQRAMNAQLIRVGADFCEVRHTDWGTILIPFSALSSVFTD